MGINNYLAKWIGIARRSMRIDSQAADQLYHGADAFRVDAVLRLLHADEPLDSRIVVDDTKRQEAQCPVRERARRKEATLRLL